MQKKFSEVMETIIFKCPFCDVVKFHLAKYLQHLQLQHHHLPDFRIVCNIEGCTKSYTTIPGFRTHIYRKHRAAFRRNAVSSLDSFTPSLENDDLDDQLDSLEDVQSVNEILPDLNSLLSGLQRHVALFILNLQEKHLLPKVTQDTIVESLQFVLRFFQQHYADLIKFHLDQSGFRLRDHEELDSLLSDETLFDCVFEYVKSEYKLIQYSKDHLDFVEPVRYILGLNSKGKEDTFQYVPLNDVFKVFLRSRKSFILFKEGVRKSQTIFWKTSQTVAFSKVHHFLGIQASFAFIYTQMNSKL